MKTILITGASGFIAGHLARKLSGAGHLVVGTSRSGGDIEGFTKVVRCSLGDSLSELLAAESFDVLIHTANYAGDDEYRINVNGTTKWFQEAKASGVGLQILLSSLSASENAISAYGQSKSALENLFAAQQQVSLRLGIVAGDGGMFRRIRQSVGSGAIVPLLDNGTPRVCLLGIDFLSSIIEDIVADNAHNRRGQVLSVQQPTAFTLRELMESIRRVYKYRCVFVPVPSLPILWALTLIELLPLNLPIGTTNIKGLRQSRHERFESHFDTFGREALPLDALVERARELEYD